MKYKLGSPEEVIRRALIHAIDERESFLDSIGNMTDNEHVELKNRINTELSDFYAMYHARYKRETPKEMLNKVTRTIDIHELLEK